MKIRTGAAAVALAVGLAACGSSANTSTGTSAAAANSTSASSSTTSSTTTSAAKTKPAKKHKTATHTTTTTSSTTSTTSSTTSTTTTTSSTTTHTTTHTTAALAPLPSPYVSGSSGQVRAELHGANHTPKIGVGWAYSVEATNAQGQPLSGSVAAQFVFNGAVVGHQSPRSFPLKNGKMSYSRDTFPAESKGIPLTFQVVITTPLGTVKLNWPVKSHT